MDERETHLFPANKKSQIMRFDSEGTMQTGIPKTPKLKSPAYVSVLLPERFISIKHAGFPLRRPFIRVSPESRPFTVLLVSECLKVSLLRRAYRFSPANFIRYVIVFNFFFYYRSSLSEVQENLFACFVCLNLTHALSVSANT